MHNIQNESRVNICDHIELANGIPKETSEQKMSWSLLYHSSIRNKLYRKVFEKLYQSRVEIENGIETCEIENEGERKLLDCELGIDYLVRVKPEGQDFSDQYNIGYRVLAVDENFIPEATISRHTKKGNTCEFFKLSCLQFFTWIFCSKKTGEILQIIVVDNPYKISTAVREGALIPRLVEGKKNFFYSIRTDDVVFKKMIFLKISFPMTSLNQKRIH